MKPNEFRAKPESKIRMAEWPTAVKPYYQSKNEYRDQLLAQINQMSELQTRLYAQNRHSLLLIFQAMDAAGKDGAIKHVMSGVNPQGCQVFSFKHPSVQESQHDFLWRTTGSLPERGRIGIFNRSYYEDVLIVRVHPELLRSQFLPDEVVDEQTVWKYRYKSIVDHESHLHRNGTTIVKFFLHISRDEQRKRFLKRIDDPEKNWKFNSADVAERARWNDYMKAYEDCIAATSTTDAPWYIVPSDDKKNARLIVADVIVKTLKSLRLDYPKPTAEHLRELEEMRNLLTAEEE